MPALYSHKPCSPALRQAPSSPAVRAFSLAAELVAACALVMGGALLIAIATLL